MRPEATALVRAGDRIGYGALDAAANAYAAELRERGVGAGQVVPLLLPRSPQLVAVQLAVLKCGAAYTGIDPRWPVARQTTIIEQASPALVVGDSARLPGGFASYRPPLDDIRRMADRGVTFEAARPDPSAPATVFFTSGTTGGPKGVVTSHRAVTRLFRPGGLDGFGPGHAMPQAAPLPWDMYAFELWGQLTSGGTAVLVEGDHLLPDALRDLVQGAGVDTLWLTTSLFNLYVDEDPDCFAGLRWAYVGGERLSPEHVRAFLKRHPGIALWNGYGPAENCMLTTTHRLRGRDCDVPGGVPVGTAVPGTSVLVLGADDRPCPPDEPGEICIAGQGLARGYLGDPELTAARFPTVDLHGEPTRIYRTGDVGVVDSAGVLHFRGRGDRQVKIAGHRVELAEVEATARRLAAVRDCVALPMATPDGLVQGLALFYLCDPVGPDEPDGTQGDALAVREQLSRLLPHYLVPGVVRGVTRFPVTANGKLDREGLLDVAWRHRRTGTARRAGTGRSGRGRV